VKNYLPFDITISSKSLIKPITLQKSEKVSIDGLSFSKPLELFLEISDFSTREPIVIKPFNDFEHINRMHMESNKAELDNYSNLMKQKFAQNSNTNMPNNLKTVKLYHKNFQQNNLTLEVSALIYFKYTNFHIELVFLTTNIIVNETGLDNMRLFYSHKREIGMPISFVKSKHHQANEKFNNLIICNSKCIYRVFNNSESKFFIDVFECESSSINIIDDIKPGQPIVAVCKGKAKQYEFVVSVNYTYVTSEMRKTDSQVDLLCKVITIKPRTIIINELEMFSVDLCLEKNKNLTDKSLKQRFSPNSNNSFYFFNDSDSLNNPLCVKIEPYIAASDNSHNFNQATPKENNNDKNFSLDPFSINHIDENEFSTGLIYDWSRPILMRYQGLITIPITYDYLDFNQGLSNAPPTDKPNKKKQKFYLNIDIKYVDLNMIVIFSEATYENTQFLFENKLDDILVRVFQYKYEGVNDEALQPKNYIYEAQNEFEKVYEAKDKKYNKAIFSLVDYLSNSGSSNNCLGIEFYKYQNNNKNLDEFGYVDYSNSYLQKLTKSIFYYSIFENKIHNHSNGKTYEYPIIDEVDLGMKKTITFEPKNKAYSENLSASMLNTSISLKIDLLIKNIGISVISDNIFYDRKHRSYSRNEILFVLLSEINFFFKKDSKLSLNYDEGEMRLSLGNLKIDNMASPHDKCRFPNLLSIVEDSDENNYNNPFFDLSVFSQIHIFDKISKITYLNYYLKKIKIAFDTDLIEDIIFFANNITYRLDSGFIDIHKIFIDDSATKDAFVPSNNNLLLSSNNAKKIFNLNNKNISNASNLTLLNNINLLKEQREKISISQIDLKNTLNYSPDIKLSKSISFNKNNVTAKNMSFESDKKYINVDDISSANPNKDKDNFGKLNLNPTGVSAHHHQHRNAKQHVYYFNTLEISNLKIILSMSSRDVQGFLNKYLNLGGFLSNMIAHIMKSEENKISLKGAKIENYSGTIKETISTIINCYRQSTFKVFLGLSAKGIFEGFLQLFKHDYQDYKNNYLLRTRIPRPLYGDFYYVKKYDTTDALVFDLIKNKKLKIHENFHARSKKFLKCEKLIDDVNREYYFIMTTKNLIIYSKTHESCIDILEYIFIEKSTVIQDDILYIQFNQDIDGVNILLLFFLIIYKAHLIFLIYFIILRRTSLILNVKENKIA